MEKITVNKADIIKLMENAIPDYQEVVVTKQEDGDKHCIYFKLMENEIPDCKEFVVKKQEDGEREDGEDSCQYCLYYKFEEYEYPCRDCKHGHTLRENEERKYKDYFVKNVVQCNTMTNYEKLMREMSVEKMVKIMNNTLNEPCNIKKTCDQEDCDDCIKKWLNEEAKDIIFD